MVKAILSLSSRFYQLAFIVHDGTGNVKFNLPKEAQSRGEKRKGLGRFAYRGFERRSEEGFRHELKGSLIHPDPQASVGDTVGAGVGVSAGTEVSGTWLGSTCDGSFVGSELGDSDTVGEVAGDTDGEAAGDTVGVIQSSGEAR